MNAVAQTPLILITGGGRGVGAATARLAAGQGYDVAISFLNDESTALAVAADVEALGRRALAVRAQAFNLGELFHGRQRFFQRGGVVFDHARASLELIHRQARE